MSKMEVIESKEALSNEQILQSVVDGFLDSIPEKGPLFDKMEKSEFTLRAIAFGELYNQLVLIAENAKNISRGYKIELLKRIGALKSEASFWTKKAPKDRNFVEEIDDMSKLIWRR